MWGSRIDLSPQKVLDPHVQRVVPKGMNGVPEGRSRHQGIGTTHRGILEFSEPLDQGAENRFLALHVEGNGVPLSSLRQTDDTRRLESLADGFSS